MRSFRGPDFEGLPRQIWSRALDFLPSASELGLPPHFCTLSIFRNLCPFPHAGDIFAKGPSCFFAGEPKKNFFSKKNVGMVLFSLLFLKKNSHLTIVGELGRTCVQTSKDEYEKSMSPKKALLACHRSQTQQVGRSECTYV